MDRWNRFKNNFLCILFCNLLDTDNDDWYPRELFDLS